MLPWELLLAGAFEFTEFDPVVTRKITVYMGKLPVEPVRTQSRIGKNTNICQRRFDEIEIASRRNRIGEEFSAIANSASFVEFCNRSEISKSNGMPYALHREFLNSLYKVRVSVHSYKSSYKSLCPLGFSNSSEINTVRFHDVGTDIRVGRVCVFCADTSLACTGGPTPIMVCGGTCCPHARYASTLHTAE